MADIRGLLQKNNGALQLARQGSIRLRTSHPKIKAAESIFENPFDDLASLNTTLTPTTFTFDDDVINSKAYRTALINSSSQQRLNQASTDLNTSDAGTDHRNTVLRSLLRKREDETIRLREQIEALSRSNASISSRLKEKEEQYSSKSTESRSQDARIKELLSQIEAATKRETKLSKGLQQLESSVEKNLKKNKKPLLAQFRKTPENIPHLIFPKVWTFAGVVDLESATNQSMEKGIVNDEMTFLVIEEEKLAETKATLERKLQAVTRESRDGYRKFGSYSSYVQEEHLALFIGGKSLEHLSDEYVNLLLANLMFYMTTIVFW
jgi:DNA repair exonuclease SbcCD ATPase subunit